MFIQRVVGGTDLKAGVFLDPVWVESLKYAVWFDRAFVILVSAAPKVMGKWNAWLSLAVSWHWKTSNNSVMVSSELCAYVCMLCICMCVCVHACMHTSVHACGMCTHGCVCVGAHASLLHVYICIFPRCICLMAWKVNKTIKWVCSHLFS